MMCPETSSIQIQGTGLEGILTPTSNTASFSYIVKTCPQMNLLKQSLGLPTITCASDAEITAAAPDIVVLVGVSAAFFCPYTYSQQNSMDSSVQY